jgi:hypothetical protein
MSEQGSKSTSSKSKADTTDTGGPQDAPGPITKAHESGTTEQTLAEQDARDKLAEARGGKSRAELDKLRENPRAR